MRAANRKPAPSPVVRTSARSWCDISFSALALLAVPSAACAQSTLYWDINGNTASLGGAGTWNTANTFWNTSATGTGGTVSAWNNGAVDNAIFGGTAGTVTLGTPITAGNLTFATTGYTLTGSTLTLGGATPTITTNAGISATINSVLAGTAGLSKSGTGTLTLSGLNTYTGATRIAGGTLAVSGSLNGTAINFTGAAAGTQLNVTSLNGLTGTTSLGINSANATVVLSAANNHTGATNLSGGTLRLADGGALANSALTINGDGTTLQLRSDTNTTFATAGGTISGFGNNGTGTYAIDANQLTSAGTGRTLTLGNLSILVGQSPTINFTGGNGYTVAIGNITGPGTFNVRLNANGVNLNVGSVTLTTAPLQALALGSSSTTGINTIGAINGNLDVLGHGSGTWRLTAPSSFTGVLHAGRTGTNTIEFSDVSQLGTGTGSNWIAIQNGSTLRYTGTGSQPTTARDLYWNLGAAVIDVTSASANLTFNITGGLRNNQITKAGAGQATLRKSTAINEFTGAPVLITGGILEFNQNNAGAISRFGGAVTGSAGTQIKVSGTGYIGNDNLTADWSANRASLDVGSGAAFDLRGNKVTVDALTGGGTVRNSFLNSPTEGGVVGYTLNVGINSGSGIFDGVIRGSLINTGEHAADAGGPNAIINLVKVGSGTQIFTGANTYAGTTTINAGTLQVGNGGTSGALGAGAISNNATLAFNRSDALSVGNVITGAGTIRQIGSGVTTLTGNSAAFTGTTSIEAGTLSVNGSLCGAMNVQTGGRLQGTGTVCNTTNFAGGTIAPGNSIGTLKVNGNYTGNGGVLEMETILSGTGSPADRLLIIGNATGTTQVKTINLGGTGAVTGTGNSDGIPIIQVGGTSTASTFQLQGGYAAAGPYQYRLNFFAPGASAAAQADPLLGTAVFGDYRLQSAVDATGAPIPVPQIPAYQSMPSGALRYGASMLNGLHQRLGDIRRLSSVWTGKEESLPRGEFFLRGNASSTEFSGDRGPDFDQDMQFVQAGGNFVKWNIGEAGSTLRLGGALSYGNSDLTIKGSSARVDLKGTTLALMTTWRGASGEYLDIVGQGTRYRTEVRTLERGNAGSPKGWGWGLSVEGGYPLRMGDGLIVEPQAQLSYQRVKFDRFTDVDNVTVDLENSASVRGRAGVRLQQAADEGQQWLPFMEVNLLHEFLKGSTINASGVGFRSDLGGTSLQLAAGMNAQLSRNASFYLTLGYEKGVSKASADTLSGNVGLRMNF